MAKYLIVQFCITNKIVFKPDLDKCFEQNLVWFTIWQQWWTNFLKTSRLRRKSRLSNNSGKAELFICVVYQTNSIGPLEQHWKEGCEPSGVDSSALSACEEATCYTNLPSACRETAKPGTLNPLGEKRNYPDIWVYSSPQMKTWQFTKQQPFRELKERKPNVLSYVRV